jgi:signal transduction histidine kinase
VTPPDDELDERLSALAHELLNPLSVAQGYATLLREGAVEADETVRGFADRVADNLEVVALLLQRLREASARPEHVTLELARIDLAAVVARTVRDLADTVTADRRVELMVPGSEVPVDADAVRLRQIVFGLVGLAARTTPPGGRVEVRVSGAERPSLTVLARSSDADVDEVRGWVSAAADGRPWPGPPMGTYVAARLVDAHGGQLGVEPGPAGGLQLRVVLPVPT